MADIKQIRSEIDSIDAEIIRLFERRMCVSEQVAEYKRQNNLPELNSKREAQVIEKAVNSLQNKEFALYTEKLFHCLMDLSKDYQRTLNNSDCSIGYQGVEGSFSYDACVSYLERMGENSKYSTKNYETFEALCLGLLNDEISLAVIPFENSSTGAVIDVYDLLLDYDYKIVGEIYVKVNHNLMAKSKIPLSQISEVYSHPQAFMQSKEFLDKYNFTQIPYKNTAISAKFVSQSERDDIACIASESAAKIYNLKILNHNINYNKNNFTKFIVLSKNALVDENSDKISIITRLSNTPGELYRLSKLFSDHGVNMVKIESRPDVNNPFNYVFFIDFIGNENDENIKDVIEKVKSSTGYFKYLGNYKKYNTKI